MATRELLIFHLFSFCVERLYMVARHAATDTGTRRRATKVLSKQGCTDTCTTSWCYLNECWFFALRFSCASPPH
eukprot:1283480-Amphidinium_carterae.3